MGVCSGDIASGGHFVETRPELVIEKIPVWSSAAERGLDQTLGYDRDLIVRGVETGSLELWRLWNGEAWAITRVEYGTLTCCCYQGRDVVAWMDWLMAQGRAMGLSAIVFFTKRRGLARMFSHYDFVEQETVYRAVIQT